MCHECNQPTSSKLHSTQARSGLGGWICPSCYTRLHILPAFKTSTKSLVTPTKYPAKVLVGGRS